MFGKIVVNMDSDSDDKWLSKIDIGENSVGRNPGNPQVSSEYVMDSDPDDDLLLQIDFEERSQVRNLQPDIENVPATAQESSVWGTDPETDDELLRHLDYEGCADTTSSRSGKKRNFKYTLFVQFHFTFFMHFS